MLKFVAMLMVHVYNKLIKINKRFLIRSEALYHLDNSILKHPSQCSLIQYTTVN